MGKKKPASESNPKNNMKSDRPPKSNTPTQNIVQFAEIVLIINPLLIKLAQAYEERGVDYDTTRCHSKIGNLFVPLISRAKSSAKDPSAQIEKVQAQQAFSSCKAEKGSNAFQFNEKASFTNLGIFEKGKDQACQDGNDLMLLVSPTVEEILRQASNYLKENQIYIDVSEIRQAITKILLPPEQIFRNIAPNKAISSQQNITQLLPPQKPNQQIYQCTKSRFVQLQEEVGQKGKKLGDKNKKKFIKKEQEGNK